MIGLVVLAVPLPTRAQSLDNVLGLILEGARNQGHGTRRYIDPPVRERRYIDPPVRRDGPAARRDAAAAGEPAMDLRTRRGVQAAMRSLGLYDGPIDGALGRGSREAIKRYQASVGAPATGFVTEGQLASLQAGVPNDAVADDMDGPAAEGKGFDATGDGASTAGWDDATWPGAAPPGAGRAGPEDAGDATTIVYDFDDNRVHPVTAGEPSLMHEIVRRIVKQAPQVLDDKDLLRFWLDGYRYANFRQTEMAALLDQVSRGDEFEKGEALERFKTILAAEATDAPLTVVRVRYLLLGSYAFGKGYFPLGETASRSAVSGLAPEMEVVSSGRHAALTVEADGWYPIDRLPYAEAEAKSFVKGLEGNRLIAVAMRLKLTDFSASDAESGVFIPPMRRLPNVKATAAIERLSVHYPNPKPGERIGALIADLPVAKDAAPAAPRPSSALQSWTLLGVPAADGELLLPNMGSDYRGQFRESGTTPEASAGLMRALMLRGLRQNPKLAEEPAMIHLYSWCFLEPAQYKQLFPHGHPGFGLADTLDSISPGQMDVFARRELVNGFRDTYLPRLVAMAPELPVRFRFTVPFRMGTYDFDKGAFPLRLEESYAETKDAGTGGPVVLLPSEGGSGAASYARAKGRLAFRTDLAALPDKVAMAEKPARDFLAAVRRQAGDRQPTLFAAITFEAASGDVPAVASPIESYVNSLAEAQKLPQALRHGYADARFSGKVVRLALYLDPQLRRLVREIDLTPLRQAAPKAPALPDDGIDPADRVGDRQPLNRWNLLALGARQSGAEAEIESILQDTRDYREANEFDRNGVMQTLRGKLGVSLPRPGRDLYLSGVATLGEYDETRQGFAIRDFALTTREDTRAPMLDAQRFDVRIANNGFLQFLPMAPDAARRLVAGSANRVFPALLKVRPAEVATLSRPNGSPSQLRFAMIAEEMLLVDVKTERRVLARRATDADRALATIPSLATPETVRLAVSPPIMPLNDETMALVTLRETGRDLDDATLRWLFAARIEAERQGSNDPVERLDLSPYGRFFSAATGELDEAAINRLLPVFKAWTVQRIAALPNRFRMVFTRSQAASVSFTTDIAGMSSDYDPVLETLGITRQAFQAAQTAAYAKANGGEPPRSIGGSVIALRGPFRKDRTAALMPLPEIAVPDAARAQFSGFVLDFVLRRVEKGEVRDGDGALLAFDAAPDEVRWYKDPKSAGKPWPQLAISKVEPVPERQPVPSARLDIVGLTLGLAQDEAERLIEQHMTVGQVLEIKGESRGPTDVGEAARLYISADGTDFISVLYGPTLLPAKVYGIARTLHMPAGSVAEGPLWNALTKKYGEPSVAGRHEWGRSADLSNCTSGGAPDFLDWRQMPLLKGPPILQTIGGEELGSSPETIRQALIARRIYRLAFDLGLPASTDFNACGPVLAARVDMLGIAKFGGEPELPGGATTTLSTRLIDHLAHRRAMEEAAKTAATQPLPTADVKL
ncbi:peptidoglycan-binding protein [Aureimonas endophytica]|uniref:peptidoglycan-binding protein n=1 Tax=Aureimonas endophytica TaxID=2027858 RepID=UPI00166B413D|nr:peptidoglycan-binding protein [Aureimonas endophytica]